MARRRITAGRLANGTPAAPSPTARTPATASPKAGSPAARNGHVAKVRPKSAPTRRARPKRATRPPTTISQYIIQRLSELGLKTVFGIPGDYVLGFYDELCRSPIEVIGTTREDCAGFAADAHARVKGLGAVCVTYCVGGLSVVNAVAGAYAEKSPLLVLSGAPGLNERARNALLHHKVRDFSTQREIFERITVASAALEDPLTAFREVDRVLDAVLRYKRPGYLELPRDCVGMTTDQPAARPNAAPTGDRRELEEALREATSLLQKSERPLLLVGVEAHRFGLQDQVVAFAEKNRLAMCTTLLGKSAVSENHPLYVGVYEGAMGRESTRRFVEDSDCVLMLGTFMTDINLGVYTANLDPARCILVTSEDLRIGYHHYHDVPFDEFLRRLTRRRVTTKERTLPDRPADRTQAFAPRSGEPVTVRRLFEKLNGALTEDMIVICDVGDALFAGADLQMHRRTEFLSPAYYTSMGFAIPAALGAQTAEPTSRPLVLVGDGAFQMTGMELSTIHRRGLNPIVVVLNNKGYTTERFIKDGAYNDINNWSYHKIPEVIGGGWGFEVRTETDLEKALGAALANRDSFSLLNVHLDPYDRSEAMERLARRLAQRIPGAS